MTATPSRLEHETPRRRSPYPLWFYAPVAVIYGTLFLFPALSSVWFSLMRWTLFEANFIGLDNFRAFFREPFLVVLDEPNANLDSEGENALTQAILGVRRRGGICVVVAHRPSALAALDLILMMADGRAQAFGPKDEILKRVLRPAPAPVPVGADAPQVAAPSIRESA